jgi:hypothetical protein
VESETARRSETAGEWYLLRAASAFLAVLILAAFTVSQRLDAALSSLTSIRADGGAQVAKDAAPGLLPVAWIVVTLAFSGGVLGLRHLWRKKLDPIALKLAGLFVITWVVAAIVGLVLLFRQSEGVTWISDDAFDHLRQLRLGLVGLSAVFAILVYIALRLAHGGPGALWRQASVIRVQLVLLALFFALICAISMTSAQAIDVLRAWTDTSFVRVGCAVAATILLGAVVRDSCTAFLVRDPPSAAATDEQKPRRGLDSTSLRPVGVAVAAIVIGAAVAIVTHFTGAFAIALAIAALVLTKQGEPPEHPAALAAVPVGLLMRTARFLGCVPLFTLFVGLVIAVTDSFLMQGPSQVDDYWLLGTTIVVGLLLFAFVLQAVSPPALALPTPSRAVARALPFGALVAVVGAGLTPSLVSWISKPPWTSTVLECLFVGGLFVLACYLAFASEAGEETSLELRTGIGAVVGALIVEYAEPVRGARTLGTFAIVMLGLIGVLLVLHALAYVSMRRERLDGFELFLPQRVPVVTLLTLWVIAAFVWGPDQFHQVRVIPSSAALPALSKPPASFNAAIDSWLAARKAEGDKNKQNGKAAKTSINMVLVAAAGGGEKVAFWTDLVLDCALSDPTKDEKGICEGKSQLAQPDRIFLTSSVSGGSVGIYRYLTSLPEILADKHWRGRADQAWSDDPDDQQVPDEALSPIAGWGLFHDLPVFLSGVATNPSNCDGVVSCRINADRAAVQEEAIAEPFLLPAEKPSLSGEKQWFDRSGEQPVATRPSDYDGAGDAPIAVFNGAIDGGIGRVIIAPYRLAAPFDPTGTCVPLTSEGSDGTPVPGIPGALDAHDLIPEGEQIPLVTATLLTARFPVVAPPGRLGTVTSRPAPNCHETGALPDVRVRDGGYMDNSGLLTIVDLLPAIKRETQSWLDDNGKPFTVHFVVVSIDDDSATLEPSPTLKQQSAGPTGIQARASSDYLTRLARDELESGAIEGVSYFRISPPPTVGAHAATGWELSSATRKRHLVKALTIANPNGRSKGKLCPVAFGDQPEAFRRQPVAYRRLVRLRAALADCVQPATS